jgi:hypothetical protein
MTVPVAERVPNRTLRAVRLALRLSQSEFAAAVRQAGEALGEPNECNKRLVQKWELGEHTMCRPNYRRALQSVTRTPYEQLGFTGAPGGLLEPLLTPRVAAAVQPVASGPSVVAEVGERLRYALVLPVQADVEEVALAESEVEHLFALEHSCAARLLAPQVGRQVGEVAALLAGTRRDRLRHQLAIAGGYGAALAGYLAFDQGQTGTARRYLDTAMAAARYGQDGLLMACALLYQTYLVQEQGDPAAGWQLAHSALSYASSQPRARAWAAVRAAEHAAMLGETKAAQGELEIGLSCASAISVLPDGPAWVRGFDRCALATAAAAVHGRLGDAKAARDAAEIALRTLGGEQIKSRALALAEIACAAARCGELDLLLEVASKAAELTERLECTLARRKLRSLVGLLANYRNNATANKVLGWLGPTA